MSNLESGFAAIRREIDRLKALLKTTADDAERHDIHTRLNECIRESMGLMDQQLQSRVVERAGGQEPPQHTAPGEREVGGQPAAQIGEE